MDGGARAGLYIVGGALVSPLRISAVLCVSAVNRTWRINSAQRTAEIRREDLELGHYHIVSYGDIEESEARWVAPSLSHLLVKGEGIESC